jgi:protein phosphatase
MGATLVAAWLRGSRLSIAHVGDSRAYLFRATKLQQMTQDHSLAAERARRGLSTSQEARKRALHNVLLRALGTEDTVEVDSCELATQEGDIILLCTDGLSSMVSDSEIANVLLTCETAQDATDRLVALANERGGKDNVTVVVIRIGKHSGRILDWFRERFAFSGKHSSCPES